MKPLLYTSIVLAMLSASCVYAAERRIKDLTEVEHDRSNVLTGLGLVAGLNGTGGSIPPTREFLVSLMQRFGRPIDPQVRAALRNDNRLTTDSMSVVVVTAELATTAQVGTKIAVTVSTLDDATDLNNGVLVATPLLGLDRNVYAVASGRVSTGGIVAVGQAASIQKNHATTGYARADVERRVPDCYAQRGFLRLLLRNPDYETAARIQEVINAKYFGVATIDEPGIIRVGIPPRFHADRFRFISDIQRASVVPDTKARVVINSQTGTIVVTEAVTISATSIVQGNITLITGETPLVSQPLPFSDGQTTVVPRTEIDVIEDQNPLTVIGETTTATDLAEALNALGVSPQDLSSIFKQLHEARVLHADLIIN